MGSFWHRKEMIGVSIWYSDKLNLGQKSESKIASSMKRLNNKKKIQKSYD